MRVRVGSHEMVITPEHARVFGDALVRVATAMEQVDDSVFFAQGNLEDVE